ncbi:MAG: IS256 family transposase, partial [Bacteroidetes bacterium]
METENLPENIGMLDMDELAKLGAKLMIKQALAAEVKSYLESFADEKTKEGYPAVVRNGYHKERKILLGSGEIEVRVPRTRHRLKSDEKFESIIVPKYIRKSPSLESALPLMYLYGISTNDILPALKTLLGKKAKGLSAATIGRLKKEWEHEYLNWKKREITEDYPIIWVDGVYFKVKGMKEKTCMLVVVGANSKGEKEILSMETGFRESTESWDAVFRELVSRGLKAPKLIIGDGAS